MKTFLVMISWMVHTKRGYGQRSKTLRGVAATDIVDASNIALKTIDDKMCPAVNCVWEEL